MAKGTRDFTANTSKLKQSIAEATEPIKEYKEHVNAELKDANSTARQYMADTNTKLDTAYLQEAVNYMAESIKQQFAPEKKRKEYGTREAKKHLTDGTTSGRKGLRLPRINMAFRLPIYEYIKIMAEVRGESITHFVNDVLEAYMEEHQKEYRKAKNTLKAEERKQANG